MEFLIYQHVHSKHAGVHHRQLICEIQPPGSRPWDLPRLLVHFCASGVLWLLLFSPLSVGESYRVKIGLNGNPNHLCMLWSSSHLPDGEEGKTTLLSSKKLPFVHPVQKTKQKKSLLPVPRERGAETELVWLQAQQPGQGSGTSFWDNCFFHSDLKSLSFICFSF